MRNPLRVVALCDSDAFYAACERVRLNLDPDEPLVVLQWDLIIAVNYPARKYGISRMDKLNDVKKKCPDCKIVHVATYREGAEEPGRKSLRQSLLMGFGLGRSSSRSGYEPLSQV